MRSVRSTVEVFQPFPRCDGVTDTAAADVLARQAEGRGVAGVKLTVGDGGKIMHEIE
jgi:hypothetical protein